MLFAARALRDCRRRTARAAGAAVRAGRRDRWRPRDPARWRPRACSRTTRSGCCCRSRPAASSGTRIGAPSRSRSPCAGAPLTSRCSTRGPTRSSARCRSSRGCSTSSASSRREEGRFCWWAAASRPGRTSTSCRPNAASRSIAGPIPAKISTPRNSGCSRFSTPRDRTGSTSRCATIQEGRSSTHGRRDEALSHALSDSVAAVTGDAPVFEMCPGLLETRFYAERGVPALAYGPGILAVSHGPREFVKISRMVECAKIYALTAARMLGGDQDGLSRANRCSDRAPGDLRRDRERRARAGARRRRAGPRPRRSRWSRTRIARWRTACHRAATRDGRGPVGAAVLAGADRVSRPRGPVVVVSRRAPGTRSASRPRSIVMCRIDAACAWSGEPIPCGVEHGQRVRRRRHPSARPRRALLGRHRLHLSEHPALPVGRGHRSLVRRSRRRARCGDDDPAGVGAVAEVVRHAPRA